MKKNYLVRVLYPKDPTATLQFFDCTPEDVSLRINKLMEPGSTVCSIEVFERISLLTKHTKWTTTS